MRRRYTAFSGAAALVAGLWLATGAFGAQAAGDDSLLGLWMTEKKGVVVELYPCEDEVCGKVVWLKKNFRRSGELRRDRHNPDPDKRSRPWCGAEVIQGLEPDGNGKLENGSFYYLGDGGTYGLDLKFDGNGTMKASAYLGIKLLGKTETWIRPGPDITPGCPPAS